MFIPPNRNGNNVITGSRRLELFFQKLGVAHDYFRNMETIAKKDYKEAIKYRSWLEYKIPEIKQSIRKAIEEDRRKLRITELKYEKRMKSLEDYFGIYENAISGRLNELDFLKAYT